VLHVAELARQYDLSGGISFRGFVERLRDAAEESEAAEAPIREEGTDGVRLMTVHKAKGLEFPVVILADITPTSRARRRRGTSTPRATCARFGSAAGRRTISSRSSDRARARPPGGLRVAYVAARARAIARRSHRRRRAVRPLDRRAEPGDGIRRRRRAATSAPHPMSAVPQGFRPDRPDDGGRAPVDGVSGRASLRRACPGSGVRGRLVDPAALHLGAEPPFGLRRQELIFEGRVRRMWSREGERAYIGLASASRAGDCGGRGFPRST